jgi:hypothetical protein
MTLTNEQEDELTKLASSKRTNHDIDPKPFIWAHTRLRSKENGSLH